MSLPSYLMFADSGEIPRRAAILLKRLESCDLCPWKCGSNRLEQEGRVCQGGYLPRVSAWAPHFGEEPALSGTHLPPGQAGGSGNVFLGQCNLRCVYCQNWQISQPERPESRAPEMSFERLSQVLLELQAAGCHNIGFVSPTHSVPQIVRSVGLAAAAGMRLPLIYNTNAYDDLSVLRMLEGIFDIYLPDLRYSEDEVARQYSRVTDYVKHSRAAVEEMYRQVGPDLVTSERGLVQRGLIIRLLILPNGLAGLKETLEWISDTLSPRVTLSVMSQYYPATKAAGGAYPLLSRCIRPSEYEQVLRWMDSFGFENGWIQPLEDQASAYYRPDFSNPSAPFADARDFSA
jgi:putative pyruvate formate lyase activating enzyme